MAKGFGVKPDKQLGYVLVLLPKVNAYAAKFSLDFKREEGPFIGITNMLAEAQTWKSPKHAKRALEQYYTDFLLEELGNSSEVRVNIKRLKCSESGELKTENAETLIFIPGKSAKP
ncbi:MAG: hypothetical protein F6K19_38255 [Cyanothece sp. SIO1E1]|nr:hypothetical protein [Cyanothece sp. SIO1E1]